MMDEMNPEWRTPPVVAICRKMLDAWKFDALPLLADALLQAGCDNAELIEWLADEERETTTEYDWETTDYTKNHEYLVAIIYSEVTAKAARWLRQYVTDNAYQCPNYHGILNAVRCGDHAYSFDSDCFYHGGGSSDKIDIPPEFWDHVSVLLCREITSNDRKNYFSCCPTTDD